MSELPILNSERKEFLDRIRQLVEDRQTVETSMMMRITRAINTADYLTPEQRDKLLEDIKK